MQGAKCKVLSTIYLRMKNVKRKFWGFPVSLLHSHFSSAVTKRKRSRSAVCQSQLPYQSATTLHLHTIGLTGQCINATMGKGGCQVARETLVSALNNEREEKIKNQPKFYWAHDEEPHRRR